MTRTNVSIKLSPSLKERLQIVANQEGLSVNALVVGLIQRYVDERVPPPAIPTETLGERLSDLERRVSSIERRLG